MADQKLTSGKTLQQGEQLVSPGNVYRAIFQMDGNFCVAEVATNRFKWGSIQAGGGWNGQKLEMKADGNCVIVNATGDAVWATETSGNAGADLEIDDQGVLKIVTSSGQQVWSTADTPLYRVPDTHPNINLDHNLDSGASLERGDQIFSPQQIYTAEFQLDGNFCVRRTVTGSFKWGSIQNGGGWGGTSLDMRADGNCVIVDSNGNVVWETETSGNAGAHLNLDDNGTLSVVSQSGVVLWSTRGNDNVFLVETMGRVGTLTFAQHLGAKPETATLTLYGLTRADSATYPLDNGTWDGLVFKASVNDFSDTYLDLNSPKIKLSFSGGEQGIVGLIASGSYIDSASFMTSVMAVVLGGPLADRESELPGDALPGSRFATFVFDRESGPDSAGTGYSYGWWMLPRTRYTPTFQALHLLLDHLHDDLALYKFPNTTDKPLPGDDFKLASYDYDAIVSRFQTDFPGVSKWHVIPELAALLLTRALRMFPSDVFGISSGGHGSPEGIMNGILSSFNDIDKCMSWVTAVRAKAVDVFDFATNCNVASLQNVDKMAKHSRYIVASDLTRNTPRPSIGTYQLGSTYQAYYSDSQKDLEQILKDMVGFLGQGWNTTEAKQFYDALADDKKASWKQQLTVFKCNGFAKILTGAGGDLSKLVTDAGQQTDVIYSEESWRQADVKELIPKVAPSYSAFAQDWQAFAVYSVDNRSTLTWDTDLPHGLLIKVF